MYLFQFTHPARGATGESANTQEAEGVSIHAPREGCDRMQSLSKVTYYVSIHAPREGCDSVVQSCVL